MLEEIKKRLQITGTYMDDMLLAWIDSAKTYLIDGGADKTATESAYGVIAKGVFDMWTSDKFSSIFLNMATQFILAHPASHSVPEQDGGCDCETASDDQIDDLFDDLFDEELDGAVEYSEEDVENV